jgi:cytochrome c biogenesis protein CcmG/thiol:disulfide interchange protein DsbE
MKPNKRQIVRWILGISIAGIVIFLVLGSVMLVKYSPRIASYLRSRSTATIGTVAPDFELPALNGERISLSQFAGQPVVLSFNATWCPDCDRAAPLIQKMHEDHPELVVLIIDGSESIDVVQRSAEEHGYTFPVLLDSDYAVDRQYAINAIPTVFFIDGNGIIQAKVIETVTPELLGDALPMIGIEP